MKNLLLVGLIFVAVNAHQALAAESKPTTASQANTGGGGTDAPASSPATQAPEYKNSGEARNFYQVLEDVLADYEYDLTNNNVQGLRDLSIRNVVASENVPPSFKAHLELLVTEKTIKHAKNRIVQCLPCRNKRATLNGDNVVITSPDSNPAELTRLARQAGVLHFMDIAFSYQSAGMILSLYITDAENGSVIWSRSYNSETSRAAALRRGVDYSQIEQQKDQTQYKPQIHIRPTIYYLFEKDLSSYVGCIGFGLRMVERYDNRSKEVGFELNYLLNSASLVSSTTTSTIYSGFNITMLFVHSWNLFGEVENFNRIRHNIFAAIGGTYTSGYLGGLIRGGWEFRMGKHWAVSTNVGFRPPGTAFIPSTTSTSIMGAEFGLGVSALF